MERYRIVKEIRYSGCIPIVVYCVQVRKDKRLSSEWVNVKGFDTYRKARELLYILTVIDMEIVPDLTKSNISKNQVEYIQKKQHEYKLTDKKRRVPGHILFSFNLKTKEIKRASITNEVSIGLNGKPIMKTKTVIEPDCYYEQALNEKNFRKRLKRIGLI